MRVAKTPIAQSVSTAINERQRIWSGLDPAKPLAMLHYSAVPEEAGPEKPFDFSGKSVARRWQAGALDMREALRRVADAEHDNELGLSICKIRRA